MSLFLPHFQKESMKKLFVLMLLFGLAACGNQSQIKDAVRERLNDPDSAKFDFWNISKSLTYACIVWNAKNQYGGYGEWSLAVLKKEHSLWRVITMKSDWRYCESARLNVLEDEEARAEKPKVADVPKQAPSIPNDQNAHEQNVSAQPASGATAGEKQMAISYATAIAQNGECDFSKDSVKVVAGNIAGFEGRVIVTLYHTSGCGGGSNSGFALVVLS